jgi:predicted N-acetyltransferase YhbS
VVRRILSVNLCPATSQAGPLAQCRRVRDFNRARNPADLTAIREINRLSFGQDDDADLVDDLRAGGFVRLSLIAEVDGQIVGHILFSRLTIITKTGVIEAPPPIAVLLTI